MREFNAFIDSCELTDIPMAGRKYTWCNNQESARWSRIDRFLLDPEWMVSFNIKLWGLPKIVSDHCPILLMEDERDWGPKPFRFLNAWIIHPSFSKVVREAWEETQITGWRGFVMLQKLQLVKQVLKRWNSEVFGAISVKLQSSEEKLHEFDLSTETRELSNGEKVSRREIRDEVWKLSKMQEWIWLQKSSSFHGSVEFKAKTGGKFKSIGSITAVEYIEAEFSKAEIWAAVRSCGGNKAPGPDGFNMLFFQKCWKVVKKEVIQFIQDFHRSVYKILSKVLANRLKLVMPRIISEEQSAFVGGRSILDGILIANEIVDWWKKTKKHGIILKLDFEKAYDSVNWSFLLSMMKNFGFGEKWLTWVQECILNTRVSVLVNGSPISEFSPS
ncbi:uncharacterized protein LOC114317682 [Camellia sinensis]|uniref:uncharacterized protein LOC114317682 n=1 Tax=Camellia sinensis TaxID=4442 RepID=UPI00103564E9|nr:uncharacterized protein LOC114317682 [Camellia sinensis]